MKSKATYLAIVGTLVIAGVAGCSKSDKYDFTPTDKRVAQKVTCVNNLKQIGLAFRIWSGDHGGKYPFQISTNNGGTWELVAPDKDGFDSNAFLYLRTMTGEDELRTPRLLICPHDKSKRVATSWTNLLPKNVTYRFRFGTNLTPDSAHEILAVCPIDGNVLYCDGSVSEKGARPDTKSEPVIFNSMKGQLDKQSVK